jgi:hypothetical protein
LVAGLQSACLVSLLTKEPKNSNSQTKTPSPVRHAAECGAARAQSEKKRSEDAKSYESAFPIRYVGRPETLRNDDTTSRSGFGKWTDLYDLSDIRDLVRTSRHNSQVRRRKGNPSMNKHPTDAKHRTVPTAPPYCTAAASTARHDRAVNSTPLPTLRRHSSSRPRQFRRDHLRQDHAQASDSSPCACRPCSSL